MKQGQLIQPDPSCIMYYTYYIILCINTGCIISENNTEYSRGTPSGQRSPAVHDWRRTQSRTGMAAITPLNATPPLDATLAAVAEVQRLDVEAMHEKVRGILTTMHGGWLCGWRCWPKSMPNSFTKTLCIICTGSKDLLYYYVLYYHIGFLVPFCLH